MSLLIKLLGLAHFIVAVITCFRNSELVIDGIWAIIVWRLPSGLAMAVHNVRPMWHKKSATRQHHTSILMDSVWLLHRLHPTRQPERISVNDVVKSLIIIAELLLCVYVFVRRSLYVRLSVAFLSLIGIPRGSRVSMRRSSVHTHTWCQRRMTGGDFQPLNRLKYCRDA